MKAICYYHDVSAPEFPVKLIRQWEQSWQANGFETRIIQERDAVKHPRFKEYEALIMSLPTVNSIVYSRACWLRWLAYELAAPAVFCDYDIINFHLTPSHIQESVLIALDQHHGGSCYGHPAGIGRFIESVLTSYRGFIQQWQGKPDISDMHVFHGLGEKLCPKLNLISMVGEHSMFWAPAVHFANAWLPEPVRHNERWRAVDAMYQMRGVIPPWEKSNR